jgi:hypothetical protein
MMDEFDDLPLLSEEDELRLNATKLPYGGLLGNSVLLRLIREIVADPHREFRPKGLQTLTSSSAPSIKSALDDLVNQGLLRKKSNDSQRPTYLVNLEDERLTALTLLAYAVHDVRDKTNCMDHAIRVYCNDIFEEKWAIPAVTETKYITYENRITYNIIISQNAEGHVDSIDFRKLNANSSRPQWQAVAEGA